MFFFNNHINVGGTTTLDIGNDVTFDSSVLNANHLTGQLGGDLIVIGRQDTAIYDGKQRTYEAGDLTIDPQNVLIIADQ